MLLFNWAEPEETILAPVPVPARPVPPASSRFGQTQLQASTSACTALPRLVCSLRSGGSCGRRQGTGSSSRPAPSTTDSPGRNGEEWEQAGGWERGCEVPRGGRGGNLPAVSCSVGCRPCLPPPVLQRAARRQQETPCPMGLMLSHHSGAPSHHAAPRCAPRPGDCSAPHPEREQSSGCLQTP